MRIEHRIQQKLSQELRATPQMILMNRILQLPRLDLEQEIELNLKENPALEMIEETRCPRCGEPLGEGGSCSVCESGMEYSKQDSQEYKNRNFDDLVSNWDSGHYEDSTTYEKMSSDSEFDPLTNTTGAIDIHEEIKRNYFMTYSSDSDEMDKAIDYMIERIDEKGLLQISDQDISEELEIETDLVMTIRYNLAHMDIIGLGAFSATDAMIIQIEEFEINLGKEFSIEKQIISNYRDLLARENINKIAQGLNIDVKRVKEAVDFIKENLYAYPGDFFESQSESELDPDFYPEPDVIIRNVDNEFYPEIVDSGLPHFRISSFYMDAFQKIRSGNDSEFSDEEKKHIRKYFEKAKFFLDCINQRRETITRICNFLIKFQRDFLENDIRQLKDLTRERVAHEIGFHPSTISRALKGKYVQLPNRTIHSFDIFFDYQRVLILVIKEILQRYETPQKLLSDDEISVKMKELGFDVARRTVAKYRERGKIPPKNIRKRRLNDK